MEINILGAGAFGSALATAFAQNKNNKITLVALPHSIEEIKSNQNRYAPDFKLLDNIEVSTTFCAHPEVIFLATPAQKIAEIVETLKHRHPPIHPKVPFIFCSKGLYAENQKPYLMTTYAQQYLEHPLHVLAGPDFAHELLALKKSFANIAGPKAQELCQALTQDHFVLEPWHDVIGLQICGCLKNVFAIAFGHAEGLQKGFNEKAALFTQAFKEMNILAEAFWPHTFDPLTFMTYGGVGDLVLTCTSVNSRNFQLGQALASGKTFENYKKETKILAEGALTAKVLHEVKGDLVMPYCDKVYDLLYSSNR